MLGGLRDLEEKVPLTVESPKEKKIPVFLQNHILGCKSEISTFPLLLTLKIDLYRHQTNVRYHHTLGVKMRSLANIYLIFFSVRGALKVPFLIP